MRNDSAEYEEPLPKKLTKKEYAAHKHVSVATVDRWIKEGQIAVERYPHGRTHRVLILPENPSSTDNIPAPPPTTAPRPNITAALQAEVVALKEANQRLEEQVRTTEFNYHALNAAIKELGAKVDGVVLALPAPNRSNSTPWWRRLLPWPRGQ